VKDERVYLLHAIEAIDAIVSYTRMLDPTVRGDRSQACATSSFTITSVST
jgi:uncharacterized protein with HEPN domain